MSATAETRPAVAAPAARDDNTLVDSSASAIISAPVERIDLPARCFSLRDDEYRA